MQYPNTRDADDVAPAFAALAALFARGRFDELLQQLPPLFVALEQSPRDRPEHARQRYQLLLLRARCLSKFDRFDEALQDCDSLMDLQLPLQCSRERAELMELISFCHANLSMPEPALRAAHVTFQDGLQLQDPLLCSQGLERAAMAYWCMGDAMEAERFMIEALGFVEQQPSAYEKLRRYSNALHLLCALHDQHQLHGQGRMAQGVLERGSRFLPLGQAFCHQEPSDFIRLVWLANVGRWQRRLGHAQLAREQLNAVLAEAPTRQWHGLRRSIQLELALLDESDKLPQRALQRLQALFEPAELRVRDIEALGAMAACQRLHLQLGDVEQSQAAAEALRERRQQRLARAREAQQRLAGLSQRIANALADADRQRVDRELQRLRRLRDEEALHRGADRAELDWVSELDVTQASRL